MRKLGLGHKVGLFTPGNSISIGMQGIEVDSSTLGLAQQDSYMVDRSIR